MTSFLHCHSTTELWPRARARESSSSVDRLLSPRNHCTSQTQSSNSRASVRHCTLKRNRGSCTNLHHFYVGHRGIFRGWAIGLCPLWLIFLFYCCSATCRLNGGKSISLLYRTHCTLQKQGVYFRAVQIYTTSTQDILYAAETGCIVGSCTNLHHFCTGHIVHCRNSICNG